MELKISIIIPVYNVKKYLDDCVNSVLNQTYENIEIILIDDGSTDKSGKMCDDWAKKDKRIKVLHKKNEGLNYARRDGFRESTGEFITFLDSDDLLHKDFLATLMESIIKNKADAAVCSRTEFTDGNLGALEHSKEETKHETLNNKKEILLFSLFGDKSFPNMYRMTAWGKLYARHLVESVDWQKSNYRAYEDNFWTPQVLNCAVKVTLLSSRLYFYRRNEPPGVNGSTLGNKLIGNSINGKPVGYIELIEKMHEFYRSLIEPNDEDVKNRLKNYLYWQKLTRFNELINANLLHEENNLSYFKDFWMEHQRRNQELNVKISQQSEKITKQTERIKYQAEKILRLETELDSHLKITRSSRLVAGNIKRKFFKTKK